MKTFIYIILSGVLMLQLFFIVPLADKSKLKTITENSNNVFRKRENPDKPKICTENSDIVFVDTVIPRIEIKIHPDSLKRIFDDIGNDHEYQATFIFNCYDRSDTVRKIGIRLRGESARMAQKKSFKINFTAFDKNNSFYGLKKMNLNGEHNDPCIMRSKLCWDFIEAIQLNACRANHVELYINSCYYGLYINIENIDKDFLLRKFGNNDGNLYKCLYPADLVYHGENQNEYKKMTNNRPIYEYHGNDEQQNYSDLIQFIRILNNPVDEKYPIELEKIFNVDNFLKSMAFDVLTGNWDGALFNKSNFYLYHNSQTGKFEFMNYDLDNTFGIDWMRIDWATRDVFNWSRPSEKRPIYSQILNVPHYRTKYVEYIRLFIDQYFNEAILFPKIEKMKTMISPSVEQDPFHSRDYGWNMKDFNKSFEVKIGKHVKYGLKEFITIRKKSVLEQINR